jgi:hypothetical protein
MNHEQGGAKHGLISHPTTESPQLSVLLVVHGHGQWEVQADPTSSAVLSRATAPITRRRRGNEAALPVASAAAVARPAATPGVQR